MPVKGGRAVASLPTPTPHQSVQALPFSSVESRLSPAPKWKERAGRAAAEDHSGRAAQASPRGPILGWTAQGEPSSLWGCRQASR